MSPTECLEPMQVNSLGLMVREFSQIVIFREERPFLSVLSANPQMVAVFGTKGSEKQIFPSLYIAGIKANQQKGKLEGCLSATQK